MASIIIDPTSGFKIPAGIAKMAAGKDAYLKKLKNKCGCGCEFVVGESQDGESCEACYELAGIYNTYQDYGAEGIKEYAKAIKSYCAEILAAGGKLDSDYLDMLKIVNKEVA